MTNIVSGIKAPKGEFILPKLNRYGD